jgi:hypothetical protein
LVIYPVAAPAQGATTAPPQSPATNHQCEQETPANDPQSPIRRAECSPSVATAAPTNPKRILGLIPNFTTTDESVANRVPLRARQKYTLALEQMFDISAHAGNLLQASIQQAVSGQPHYRKDAFGRRLIAAESDQITSCLFIYGILPSLLHDDPRYFRRVEGTPISRTWYAVSRTFVTRTDRGSPALNTSQLAGQFAQASLSNLYYPHQDRNATGTLANWAVQLAYNSTFNILKEFYPDVAAKLHRHPMAP